LARGLFAEGGQERRFKLARNVMENGKRPLSTGKHVARGNANEICTKESPLEKQGRLAKAGTGQLN